MGGVERMRRTRARHREGLQYFTGDASHAVLNYLIDIGALSSAASEKPAAVGEAIAAFLEQQARSWANQRRIPTGENLLHRHALLAAKRGRTGSTG